MNLKSIIMLCVGIIAATAIASIDKIQPLINDRNIIQLENGNVRLGKVVSIHQDGVDGISSAGMG